MTFEFYRLRFHFRAMDAVHFPARKAGNVARGAVGSLLRETAAAATYARLFEPGWDLGESPSGLRDWPRPFVLRASHLGGVTVPAGGQFYFDLHLFDLREPARAAFRAALEGVAIQGIGPGRGRAELAGMEQLDLEERVVGEGPSVLCLDPEIAGARRVRVQFVTPTELKGGETASAPEFAILFARLRDRIATLRALYGAGPLEIDFRGMGERAAAVRLVRSELSWERAERRSARTGQAHPLGGFTGEVEYEGDLAEFLPWLRAGRWVGVGRQTVWGKGEVRVVPLAAC